MTPTTPPDEKSFFELGDRENTEVIEVIKVTPTGEVLLREGCEYKDTGVRMPAPIGADLSFAFEVLREIARTLIAAHLANEELAKALEDMLLSHFNLYRQTFGQNSDPENDCIRRQAEEAIFAYRNSALTAAPKETQE